MAYFPFGGGPRLCIGNNFAMMEAVLLLATLAQGYRLELTRPEDVIPQPTITLRPKHGIKVRLKGKRSCESRGSRVNPWLILTLAIIGELVGTTALKLSAGFTRFLPSLFVVAGYGAAIWLLSQSIQRIPIGISYAIWSGAGAAAAALIGVFFFRESLGWFQGVSIGLIIVGVVGLNLSSQPH